MNIHIASNFLVANQTILNELVIPTQQVAFPVKYFYYHIGERIRFSSTTLIHLFDNNPEKHLHGIGLIMRNVCSDFILASYFYCFYLEESVLRDKLIIYLNNEINKDESYIELIKQKNIIPQEELDKIENSETNQKPLETLKTVVKKQYQELQNKAGNKKLTTPSISAIVSDFPANEYGLLMEPVIIKAYDTWKYFSQFEHVGINSYSMTRNIDKILKIVISNVEFILLLTNVVCDILDNKELQNKNGDLTLQFQKYI